MKLVDKIAAELLQQTDLITVTQGRDTREKNARHVAFDILAIVRDHIDGIEGRA